MYCVIRNGEYLESEKLLFGDIQVPQRPHKNSILINNEWVINADDYFAELDKEEAKTFLNNTDWQILRHKEEKELGIQTSLTEEVYLNLIQERQERRMILNDIIK